MASDKTIPELPGQLPQLSDLLVGDNGIVTYKFTEAQLIALLQANLSVGAVFTFASTAIPSNTVGNNGDVFWKTDTGQIAQKVSGTWTVVYTIVQGVVGSTIYYGSVAPTTQGINGDTYLQTVGGNFYNKIAGSWVLKFSMATGPVGPAGANGTNGTNGIDGKTILNGTVNPSNLSDGVNGDFYINTSTWNIFGPKTAGAWGSGTPIAGGYNAPVTNIPFTGGSVANPLVITTWQSAYYPIYGNGSFKVQFKDGDGNLQDQPYLPLRIINRPVSGSITQTGISLDTTGYPDGQLIIYYSNEPII
ncbi:MAG: hypothetical protein P4L31_07495 [Candidatus Babeliales bacterium]|nr:hypothetical protein [Candidatus Babeliales bacterium]